MLNTFRGQVNAAPHFVNIALWSFCAIVTLLWNFKKRWLLIYKVSSTGIQNFPINQRILRSTLLLGKSVLDFESPKVKLHNRYCHKLYSYLDWIERGFLVFGPKCQNDQNQFAIVQSLTRPHSPLTVDLWSQINRIPEKVLPIFDNVFLTYLIIIWCKDWKNMQDPDAFLS